MFQHYEGKKLIRPHVFDIYIYIYIYFCLRRVGSLHFVQKMCRCRGRKGTFSDSCDFPTFRFVKKACTSLCFASFSIFAELFFAGFVVFGVFLGVLGVNFVGIINRTFAVPRCIFLPIFSFLAIEEYDQSA